MADKLNVLIPTSGLGSRLGELTEHTNKALVRVGTKAVISHIIDAYPKGTAFHVMLGHKGELVRQYLTLAHPEIDVCYLDYELKYRENVGLVKALRLQRERLVGPLVFHASDTIVTIPDEFLTVKYNAVLGARMTGDTHDYRMIRSDGRHTMFNFAQRIMEKGEQTTGEDMVHIGVVRFAHVEEFCKALGALEAFHCDTHILNKVVENGGSRFAVVEAQGWHDTGNMSKLTEARKHFEDSEFVLLEKVDQGVYLVGDRVLKFFADPKMVERRVERAKTIGSAVPEILGCTHNFFAYRKAAGRLARDVMQAAQVSHFLDWAGRNLWVACKWDSFEDRCDIFYRFKTLHRVGMFYKKTGLTDQADIINGCTVPTLGALLGEINWAKVFTTSIPTPGMHGDLHFSNILCQEDGGYALLDWRESFGDSTLGGDVYYDLAKILHGLIVSHDLVEQNRFLIEIVEKPGTIRNVTFDIMRHHRLVECEAELKRWCEQRHLSWTQVRLICALVFLNIGTLHHHPYDKFLYFLGKSMMYDLLLGKDKPL